MALTLLEMDDRDFASRREPMVTGYATAISVARGLSLPEAAAESERDIAERLPRGPATRGQLLRKAVVDGAEVGWIWVSLPGTTMPEMAWISDVEVDAGHRRRGYGAAIITAVEAELAQLGVSRLGLNVFGDNDTARRLYERLGFEVTAQQRSRSLVDVPSAAGVELVPMIDYAGRVETLFAEYAQHLVEEQGVWHGEAEARSARRLAELLPHGDRTEGTIMRTVLAKGEPAGWVWAAMPAPPRPGLGWLHHVGIDEAFRSRGHGRAVIAAIEAEMVHRGVRGLGLNVDGSNQGARRLFERLGYGLLAQQMAKDLP
ncbi:GNAT family N-acetyltransferase [Actinoplanes sp. NPDC049118]|uniref:GNAT family N-acetyltransferase n=1 Tax=Actinoplanes sp. NPDC049118 TaxID=3155769 RepID=UPI0033DED974